MGRKADDPAASAVRTLEAGTHHVRDPRAVHRSLCGMVAAERMEDGQRFHYAEDVSAINGLGALLCEDCSHQYKEWSLGRLGRKSEREADATRDYMDLECSRLVGQVDLLCGLAATLTIDECEEGGTAVDWLESTTKETLIELYRLQDRSRELQVDRRFCMSNKFNRLGMSIGDRAGKAVRDAENCLSIVNGTDGRLP